VARDPTGITPGGEESRSEQDRESGVNPTSTHGSPATTTFADWLRIEAERKRVADQEADHATLMELKADLAERKARNAAAWKVVKAMAWAAAAGVGGLLLSPTKPTLPWPLAWLWARLTGGGP
jgi:hypothetical protein